MFLKNCTEYDFLWGFIFSLVSIIPLVLHTWPHPNITLIGSTNGRNLRYCGYMKNHVIFHFMSPSVTKFSNLFLWYSCSFLLAFENWYSNAVAFKFIAHTLMSLLERTSGVRASRHRKPNSFMGWHCLRRLGVLSACLPKVKQRTQLTETVRANIGRFPSAA